MSGIAVQCLPLDKVLNYPGLTLWSRLDDLCRPLPTVAALTNIGNEPVSVTGFARVISVVSQCSRLMLLSMTLACFLENFCCEL